MHVSSKPIFANKMSLKIADIFDYSLFLLKCIGVDPCHYGLIFKINGPFIFVSWLILTILLFGTFLHGDFGNIEFLALTLNSFTIYHQVRSKVNRG